LKRPDFFIDKFSHAVGIECDENKHRGYSCENKRMMELSQDIAHRPFVLIRLNPDAYVDKGVPVSGCWGYDGRQVLVVKDKQGWDVRMRTLLKTVEHWLNNVPDKTITVVELFY